jgi:hypothetical protein
MVALAGAVRQPHAAGGRSSVIGDRRPYATPRSRGVGYVLGGGMPTLLVQPDRHGGAWRSSRRLHASRYPNRQSNVSPELVLSTRDTQPFGSRRSPWSSPRISPVTFHRQKRSSAPSACRRAAASARHRSSVALFGAGLLVGAGLALLFAPTPAASFARAQRARRREAIAPAHSRICRRASVTAAAPWRARRHRKRLHVERRRRARVACDVGSAKKRRRMSRNSSRRQSSAAPARCTPSDYAAIEVSVLRT